MRIDLVAEVGQFIYIFEFKLTRSSESVLKQIEDHDYHERYLASQKTVVLVGLTFAKYKEKGKTKVECTCKVIT